MEEYGMPAFELLTQAGAEIFVAPQDLIVKEGKSSGNWTILVKFQNSEVANRFYTSEEYAPLKKLRIEIPCAGVNFLELPGCGKKKQAKAEFPCKLDEGCLQKVTSILTKMITTRCFYRDERFLWPCHYDKYVHSVGLINRLATILWFGYDGIKIFVPIFVFVIIIATRRLYWC